MKHEVTPSQTIGPFPHEAWGWAVDGGAGALVIEGALYDGDGAPVDDGWVEAWIPAAVAGEAERALPGFRRVPTGARGEFRLQLPLPARGEPAAWITVFARGLLVHRCSAVFLADDPAVPADAPLLAQVPAERRGTLLATRAADGTYRWDIRLQGDHETVFFDYDEG